jgi:hypothetical protein
VVVSPLIAPQPDQAAVLFAEAGYRTVDLGVVQGQRLLEPAAPGAARRLPPPRRGTPGRCASS